MIGLQAIETIIELAIYSGYLKGDKPTSLLLTAKVEAGKTEAVKKFILNKGLLYLTDATAWGIINKYLPTIETGRIKHIIIPDLIIPLEKSKSTRNSFIAFMSALIEEGIIEISTYAVRGLSTQKEVNVGLIACIAKEKLHDRRHQWYKIGFLSRMVPVSWDYPITKILAIFNSIVSEEHLDADRLKLKIPRTSKKIDGNKKIFERLVPFSTRFAVANKIYGFRMQKQLQSLLKANALKEKRTEVTKADFNKFLEFADYINLEYKKV